MDCGRLTPWLRWLGLLVACFVAIWVRPAEAGMVVTKTASPTVAGPGTTVTYTISVYNSNPTTWGPNQIEVTDTLPGTFGAPTTTSITLNGAALALEVPQNLGGNAYRWRRGGARFAIDPDKYLVITFTSTISGAAPNGAYPNNVTVQDFAAPPDPTVSTGPTAVVTIGSPPSLDVVKTVSPAAVTGAQTVTYTATVTNSGATGAIGVSFVDTLPSGFTYVPGSSTYNGVGVANPAIAGQTLTWSGLANIPSNTSRVLTFQATTTATTGSYDNTITVNASNAISDSSGPTATVTVNGAAPLTISKTASTAAVNPGNSFQYTIIANNPAGNPAAQVSSFQDLLPPNFNYGFVSQYSTNGGATWTNTGDPSQAGRTMTWTGPFPAIAAGGNLRLRFTVYAPTEYSGTFSNVGTVNGVNFASVSTLPMAAVTVNGPVYAISKTVNSGATTTLTVPPATTVNYQITIKNSVGINGTPAIQDVIPTGFTYVAGSTVVRRNGTTVSTANPTIAGSTLTWAPGSTINSTQTLTVDFQATVPAGTTAGVYPNNAQVTDAAISGNVPVATGDTAQVIVNSGGPNMQVSKSVDRSTVLAFETVVYTIRVQNLPTATNGANALIVSDMLPTGFSYQPGTAQICPKGGSYGPLGNPAISGQTLTWSAGLPNPLAANNYFDLRFTAQVGGTPGVYSNTVTVGGTNFTDVTTGLTAPVTVGTPPVVTITKSASPASVATSGTTTYTITLTNSGGQTANNVSVTDVLPAGFTVINGSSTFNGVSIGNPSAMTGTVTWVGPFTIPAGATRTLTFGATVPATAGTYNNSAAVSGSNFSPVNFGPGATVTVGVSPPNISINESFSVSSLTVPPAQTLTVTVTLVNPAGLATANGTTLSVYLPDGVSYVLGTARQSVNAAAPTVLPNPSGTTYGITFSGLASVVGGQTNTITFQVQVATTAVTGYYYLTTQANGSNFVSPQLAAPGDANPDAPALTVTSSSAVDLLAFQARTETGTVVLDWETGTEWQNLGFNVYRSQTTGGPGVLVTPGLVGLAGSSHGGWYAWTDRGVQPGQTYYYWLEDLEFGGVTTRRGPLAVTVPEPGTPDVTALWQPPTVPVGKTGADPAGPTVTSRSAAQQLGQMLQVVERTATGLTLELRTPMASVQTVDGRAEVLIPGLSHVWEDGLLRLPQAVVPVAIPAGAAYTVQTLQEADQVAIPAPALLANEYLRAPPVASPGTATAPSPPPPGRGLGRKLPQTGEGIGLRQAGGSAAAPSPLPSVESLPSTRPADEVRGSRGAGRSSGNASGADWRSSQGWRARDAGARHLQFAFGVLAAPQAPTQAVSVGLDGQAGENRILQLKLFPVRPDPVTGNLIQSRTLRIRVSWQGDGASGELAAPDRYARALDRLLDGRAGWSLQAADQSRIQDAWVAPTGPAFTVTVSDSGLQELAAEQLTAAGVSLAHPERWQLLDHNRQVPLEVRQSNGQLQTIRFVVPKVGGRYSRENRYVLATDHPGTPQRMRSVDATPVAGAPLVTSQEAVSTVAGATYYWANMPADGASDHWFGDYVTPDHPAELSLPVTGPRQQAAELTIGLRGMGRDLRETLNNQVEVSLNDTALGTLRWAGDTYLSGRVPVPAGILVEGANRLRLSMVRRSGLSVLAAYVDQVSLHYQRTWVAADGETASARTAVEATAVVAETATGAEVYDVTDAAAPLALQGVTAGGGQVQFRLAGRPQAQRFVVATPQTLHAPSLAVVPPLPALHEPQQADYLIIVPQAFAAAAERLAEHRRGQGYMVTVVPVAAIWHEFGGGNAEPTAIRDFLRWTAHNWQKPRPTHVVLLGDGHFDYRNDFGTSPTNWLPPLLAANPLIGEIADDNALVCVMGDDPLPDLFLGRLPANSPEEAEQLVTKVITADQPVQEPWHQQAIAIADDDEPGFGAFVGQMTEVFSAQRNWLRLGMGQRDDLRSALDGGASLVLFVGHGSPDTWGSEGIFTYQDVDSLQPTGAASLLVAADCLNGYFQDPDYPSIGELMLRADQKGAMAVFSTGGYTLPSAQYPLVRQFLHGAIHGHDDLGTASTMAKLQMVLEDAPMWYEELRGWNLLGDPASHMPGVTP
jgi:uncharacterized repeat protein (TIGR01451 family)/fimbrial isopeptide formation D2 family protein